jgi:mannose-6-phosphate isomerase
MNQPLFLQPVFQERIWGGTALKDLFGYDIPSKHTGECWAISGHPNGQSVVKNGPFRGKNVGELWEQHRELFGNHPSPVFPLLTKRLFSVIMRKRKKSSFRSLKTESGTVY